MSLFSSRLFRVSGLSIIQVGTTQSHRTRLLFSPNAPASRVASFPLASISTLSPSSNPAESVIRSPTSSVPCLVQVSAYWLLLMMRVIWVSMSSSSPMIPIRQSSCSSVSFIFWIYLFSLALDGYGRVGQPMHFQIHTCHIQAGPRLAYHRSSCGPPRSS